MAAMRRVVIMVQENHTTDNYFRGLAPYGGAVATDWPIAANPPAADNPHDRKAYFEWLTGASTGEHSDPQESVQELATGVGHAIAAGSRGGQRQVDAVVQGGGWDETVFMLTWDDWGGYDDHVKTPVLEYTPDNVQLALGPRVPLLMFGGQVKPGIDSRWCSHVSIPKTAMQLLGLPALGIPRLDDDAGLADLVDPAQTPTPPPRPSEPRSPFPRHRTRRSPRTRRRLRHRARRRP